VTTSCANRFSDSLFVNHAARNVRVQPSSPAVGLGGTRVTPPNDFEGVSRPQGSAPDGGAFER
jgi:hypothetical protein